MKPGLMQAMTRDQVVDWKDIQQLIAIANKYYQFYTSFEKGKPFTSTKTLKQY